MVTTAAALAQFRRELIKGGFSDETPSGGQFSEVSNLVRIYAQENAADVGLRIGEPEPELTYTVSNTYTQPRHPDEIAKAVAEAIRLDRQGPR